ncbi:hypothetical protein RFZ66_19030, partial [Acinetobacter baumannii]|nr:hypothetical protein [Acinetobacter baumannii]
QASIDFRLRTRYVDEQATDLDDALARIDRYTKEGKAISIALHGNAAGRTDAFTTALSKDKETSITAKIA